MKEFNFFNIKQDSIDNKKSSLLLSTLLSVVGIAVLAIVELVVTDDDEDEDLEADPSEE